MTGKDAILYFAFLSIGVLIGRVSMAIQYAFMSSRATSRAKGRSK